MFVGIEDLLGRRGRPYAAGVDADVLRDCVALDDPDHHSHTLLYPAQAHLLPDSLSDPETEAVLPRMPHTNNNRTPCACNCGRTVAQREDPFTLKVRAREE